MKSKGGARKQPASAPAPAPAANTPPSPPTSPTGGKAGAKYRNRDGSKFITLPDSTSAPSSAQHSPTMPGAVTARPLTAAPPVATDAGPATSVNRKKQKRREKAAAKAAAAASVNGTSNHASSAGHDPAQDPEDSDEDEGFDGRQKQNAHSLTNGHALGQDGKSKKSKKKKKKGGATSVDDADSAPASTSQPTHGPGISKERIWNTSSQEERERIKEFWLGLGEDERKSLVKVEKDAVLQKMKEQQKHTCSCSVCGRKRNAIEEELEGLYDAYYEELEQFANHPQQDGHPPMLNSSRHFGFPNSRFPSYAGHQPSRGRIVEPVGDDEEEELDEPYSDDELEDVEAYSDDEPEQEVTRDYASDFFNFGSSLTVQGGILTVADDLLKNDGKKFIEMMEQLAERRMAREGDLTQDPYARTYGHSVNGSLPGHDHPPPPPVVDEEYEDDEDEDYDDSQEEDYEEDDDETMTDEQRMEEGRRMFQIFAARMFEQRVLHAYREKVAKERQLKLVEEEEEEARKKEAQKEKKAREAQRKKEKAAQKKAAAAEEKARKEAERALEEEAQRQAEAEKAEEARRKAEEKRKKREAQKKAEDDERARKEAEKQRQKQLQIDHERKAKESKEREKKAREEKLQQEKEAREQKEREASELREKQDAERRQKENVPAKAEAKTSQKLSEERAAKKAAAAMPATKPLAMRQAQLATNPALPVLPQQPPATSFASPKPSVATPALPKAPTPMRLRQPSQQDAAPSMPTTTTSLSETTSLSHSPVGNTPIPSSPGHSAPASHRGSIASHHSANISQTMSPLQPNMTRFPPTTQPAQHNVPLGGMNFPPALHHAPPPGLGIPMFPPVPPGYRPPPGMAPPGLSSPMLNRSFATPVAPPGFHQPQPDPIGVFGPRAPHDANTSSHSRQPSGGFESPMMHAAQPIVRPTPIGRPASVVHGQRLPIAIPPATGPKAGDDMENHLGSSALLDDSDDVVPTLPEFGSAPRRGYAAPGRQQGFPSVPFGDPGMLQQSQQLWGTSPIQNSVLNSFMPSPVPPPGFGGPAGWPISSPVPGFSTPMNRPIPSRQPVSMVRQKLCNVCRDMAMRDPSREGLIDLHVVLDMMKDIVEFNPFGTGPLTEKDVLILCETEGTMVNGGGNFDIVEDGNGRSIRWNEHKVPQPVGAFGAPGQFGSPSSSFGR
ncbi:unnamed protein product [Discula destructiva]